ncbi:electron transfer flavoprotein subunit beta/FixA family protein [Natronobacterium gregoryi]|uniref:Electron transfer flavoprotein alpha/beta-subunit n=2 Tax=Natronobacterium gregoryi TaxID=44930 RepID=L0AEY5_NATGS|nr:electron transfer flavoprotein subunit beta [Natronobacterium gregoryi]AFZ71600.1 electron transfer flavoprotein, beta subunit [Natronobacterium gregoryi SP2]ELY66655.1 Electron transfer flavoprotein alpha/beta-subunit [Natronobacterium gregoryi SP2]PLK21367.1 electron transfer flavoprotein subunit beta [Natronobacterium gregoryi SP2]SFI80759.1 electron transfer flavoprotein beta subunit [Natronobacterium gregoryi]
MRSIVLTKGVPDFSEGAVSFDEDGHLERGKTPTVMNPNDAFALEAALQTRVRHGGHVTGMSMGPPGYADVLQEAMESVYTDDSYLLSDRELAASDTWATSITLSAGLEKYQEEVGEIDLVFAGFKSADGETGQTGPQTAWAMEWSIVTHVIALEIDPDERRLRAKRLVEGDVDEIETVEAPLPCFVVTDPEFEPTYRKASHRLTHKQLRKETQKRAAEHEKHLTTWDHVDLNLDPDYIGLDGSPTIVSSVDPIPKAPSERDATMIDPDEDDMSDVLEEMQPFAAGAGTEAGE